MLRRSQGYNWMLQLNSTTKFLLTVMHLFTNFRTGMYQICSLDRLRHRMICRTWTHWLILASSQCSASLGTQCSSDQTTGVRPASVQAALSSHGHKSLIMFSVSFYCLGFSWLATNRCTMADRPQCDRKPAKTDKELVDSYPGSGQRCRPAQRSRGMPSQSRTLCQITQPVRRVFYKQERSGKLHKTML